MIIEDDTSKVQYLKLLKVQGQEYKVKSNKLKDGSPVDDKASDTPSTVIRKPPFNIAALEKKNSDLENIIRKKFISGEIIDRKPGHDNFICTLGEEHEIDIRDA